MIKLLTVKRMAERGRETVFRVRWRALSGNKEVDTDGEEGEPDSWRRWSAEYFQKRADALEASERDKGLNALRPRGLLDRDITAKELWRRFSSVPMLEEGRLSRIEEIIEHNPLYAQHAPVAPAEAPVPYALAPDISDRACGKRLDELESKSRQASLTPVEMGEFAALIKRLSAR